LQGLAALRGEKGDAADRSQREIGQQIFEREQIGAIGWLIDTSWMPRTSPTFQSCFGLSGCTLWQLTQAGPITTGTISRTSS
jgi:hypothetical protein